MSLSSHICAFLLCLVTPSIFASPNFLLPPDHQSTYSVTAYGAPVGKMHNRLLSQDDTIHYTSEASATGLATLLVSGSATETSVLTWPDRNSTTFPELQSYRFNYGKKQKKNQTIKFSRDEKGLYKIDGTYKNKTYSLTSEKKVWDRHMIPLLMSSDLQLDNDKSTGELYISDKGSLQTYTYTLKKTENIKFQGQNLAVLKFMITKLNSKRMSYVWLSKTHYYLPLKVEQYKSDELQGGMLLETIEFTKSKDLKND
ncbi:hypothetical protein MNBD_GAMMA09-3033 [hydrothermal vent metagenome]|uniref:DUF3108 domain-containing protein n=1 Tax=hydrothermal vent metagenome TaxID=652676 RepID=A0A3B0XV56_9ZZZZ